MPLSNPPQVNVIYAELNTPGDGTETIAFEDWYDLTWSQGNITATKTAALAAMGLSYAAGVFTTLRKGVWDLNWEWFIDPTPGGACSLQVVADVFSGSILLAVADPNTLGTVQGNKTIALPASGTFWWSQTCTNGTDTPLTYMDVTITRLV